MSNFAVIKTGGKQYLVKPNQKLRIEKIPKPAKGEVNFDEILALGEEGKIEIGTPFLKSAKVKAEWLSEGKGDKVIVARYHSKTRYRKLKGHRQPFTEVLIKEIVAK
ncbi:MAG: 50S ribosomal protein L21 [bacterium]|nr:50S ribosomal protein L21 [bacterium]